MAINSSIEWTESTWNPVTGCTKISPGCKHCYAEAFAERWRGIPGHPYEQGFDLRLWPDRLTLPLRWKHPRVIFVNSMSDLFHADVPDRFIEQVFSVMRQAQHHVFQLLTKRPERFAQWARRQQQRWPRNVWAGVSVESEDYTWRIQHLQHIPADIRFLSIEPLLGPVCLTPQLLQGIHWVIVGGESGPKARRMDPRWVTDIRDTVKTQDVSFFFKQWGTFDARGQRVGKRKAGRMLQRRTWNEMPVRLHTAETRSDLFQTSQVASRMPVAV